MSQEPIKHPLVRRRDETEPIDCPFGHVERIVTGGEGGIANVHVVSVTKGLPHRHEGYDEVDFTVRGLTFSAASPTNGRTACVGQLSNWKNLTA